MTVLKDLKPGTAYKYIAFGLSADGKVYGSSASVEFETKLDGTGSGPGDGGQTPGNPEVDGMKVNKAWTVNYVGEGVVNGEDYDHVVTVNSTDRNTYAITIVYASLWNLDDLYDMAVLFAEDLVAYVDEYNDYYGTSFTVGDALYSGTASDAFDLYPGYPKFMSMFYAAEVDGQYMCFTETENLPTFRGIAEMNPVETKSKVSKAMIMPIGRL